MDAKNHRARLFRNNVGLFETKGGHLVKTGLCAGSSDLIGFSSKIVTQDMVGKKIAIFTAIEVKTKKGRSSKDQMNFISAVKNFGGIAGVARSKEDLKELLIGK